MGAKVITKMLKKIYPLQGNDTFIFALPEYTQFLEKFHSSKKTYRATSLLLSRRRTSGKGKGRAVPS